MGDRYWLEVSISADGEAAEAIAATIQPYAHAGSVVFEQRGAATDSHPEALEPLVAVKIYVPSERDTPELRRKIEEACYHLNRLYPIPAPQFKELADEDWATAWRKDYRPFRVGSHLWIQPSWLDPVDHAEEDVVITLDPGMAFGTGLHPSTQLCLQAVERYLQPNMRVLDVGAGSGILSIASALLGARTVIALDNDIESARATVFNAKINLVGDKVRIFQGELPSLRTEGWDLVLVNILAPVIVDLLDRQRLMDYLTENGYLVLSGIIDDQVGEVEGALDSAGGVVIERYQKGDWTALLCIKTKTSHPRGDVTSFAN